MNIDKTTATMIEQLQAAALQIFNQYADGSDFMPDGPVNLHTILHKRQDGDRNGLTIADRIRMAWYEENVRLYGPEPESVLQWNIDRELYRGHHDTYRRLCEKIDTYKEWHKKADSSITIHGDGFKISLHKYDVFRVLENLVHATEYPTSRLIKYAI